MNAICMHLLNIKLTDIFKKKFCAIYEKFITIVPNFRKISLSHILQPNRTYKHTHIYITHAHTHNRARTHTHTHTHTHTYKQPQNGTCLRRNKFSVSYQVFRLAYEALVGISRKFSHKAITIILLQQHDMLYDSMFDIYYVLKYIFYTRP